MPAANNLLCASRLAVINAPYECPLTATLSGSVTPISNALLMAASASATSCSTNVSLGSLPSAPTIGKAASISMAYPCVTLTRADGGLIVVKVYGDPLTWPAAEGSIYSRGYAHKSVGRGPSADLS